MSKHHKSPSGVNSTPTGLRGYGAARDPDVRDRDAFRASCLSSERPDSTYKSVAGKLSGVGDWVGGWGGQRYEIK